MKVVILLISLAALVSTVFAADDCDRICNCPRIYKPVCASNGKETQMFGNDCRRLCDTCQTQVTWTEVDKSKCPTTDPQIQFPSRNSPFEGQHRRFARSSSIDDPCLRPIPTIHLPVCGSDGKVYSNQFELDANNECKGTKITVVHPVNCRDFPKGFPDPNNQPIKLNDNCSQSIPTIYFPVCGSDGKVYSNKFELEANNDCKGTRVTIVDPVNCPSFPKGSPNPISQPKMNDPCNQPVPNIYFPVCGSDGKVYDSKFVLDAMNACQGKSVTVVNPKNCPQFPTGIPAG